MSNIRYHEAEALFAKWPRIRDVSEELSAKIDAINAEAVSADVDDDYIYSLCIGNKVIDNMPPSGRVSDTTGSIAALYYTAKRYDKRATLKELRADLYSLTVVVSQMELAFRRLNPMRRVVLQEYYWSGSSEKEIAEKTDVHYSRWKIGRERVAGMRRFAGNLAMTVEEYEKAIAIIEE